MAVTFKPDQYHILTPYLVIRNASSAIEFYQKVFGAAEQLRMEDPSGKIGHAELKIGDSVLMLADEYPDMGFTGPEAIGGSPVSLMVYVKDVDATFKHAIDLGATEVKPVQDQFYGDRAGTLKDPFGHIWTISTHIEDVSEEELHKRMQAMFQK